MILAFRMSVSARLIAVIVRPCPIFVIARSVGFGRGGLNLGNIGARRCAIDGFACDEDTSAKAQRM
jgi:hypothetical protein